MAGVNISSVVEQLEGSLVRSRDQGLEDLKYLLASSRNGTKLDALGDDGFHRLLESLYHIIRTDKSAFLKAGQAAHSKSKATATTNRLSSAAVAFRLTVEAAVSKIKFKTVISVIDHIISTLPTPDEEFIEPLRNDYFKCFRILVEYPPYAEHLKPKQWQEFVDFLIASISISLVEDEQDSNHLSGRETSMNSRSGSYLSVHVSQGQRSSRYGAKSSLEDILGALRALSDTTNAPVLTRASTIINAMVEILISSHTSQAAALAIFNNVALVLMTEGIELLLRSLTRLIPIIHRLWSSKSAVLRDLILVTISICRPMFLVQDGNVGYLEPSLREKILAAIQMDYMERNSRELLQSDDVAIQLLSFDQSPPGYRLMPRGDNPRALSSWTLLTAMTTLLCGLSRTSHRSNPYSETSEQRAKRRKLSTPFHELLQRARQSDGTERLAAIQVLLFAYDQPIPVSAEIEESIPNLESLLLNDDPQLVVWTMFLFSRFACSTMALKPRFTSFWARIWDQCRRSISSSSTSRAACLLINIIVRTGALDSVINATTIQDCVFAGGKSGPSTFSDAALMMFTSILQSDYVDRDEAFESLANKIVAWLELYWTLPSTLDRSHNSLIALHGQAEFLCALLSALRGSPLQFEVHPRNLDLHPSALVEARLEGSRAFSAYLCGLPHGPKRDTWPLVVVKEHQLSKESASRLNQSAFDLLQSKLRDFQSSWAIYAKERSSNIGDDILVVVTTTCMVIRANIDNAGLDPSSLVAVAKAETETWQKIIDLLVQQKSQDNARPSFLASKILRIRDPSSSPQPLLSKQLLPLMQALLNLIRRSLEVDGDEEIPDVDMMDSMETRTSQGTLPSAFTRSMEVSRREVQEDAIPDGSPSSYLLDLSIQSARGLASDMLGHETSSSLVDEFTGLDSESLLAGRQSLYALFKTSPIFTRADAARLLKHVAQACLQNDHYERSEAAMCCCAKTMTYLAPMWTSDVEDELADCAFDIYGWFISTALGKGIASPQAWFDIALLLDIVSKLAPSYGSGDDMPSPRTSLLKILLDGPSVLKFRLSTCVTHMFDRYVLAEHGAIFDDIVEALPADPDNIEGIAVRFHVLAELGSRWHTVLRQTTYHLFETAINVPKLTSLGRHCLNRMSVALELASAKELFHAFAPQIFYTWLGHGPLDQIPYQVFGYERLEDLVLENESELVAQIALRASKDHAKGLTEVVGSDWSKLLEKHFAHAEGYCLASQTSLPSREQLHINSESLIRTALTTEIYSKSIRQDLPSIVATLFKALQDDYGVERAFEKSGLTGPLSTLRRICGLSASASSLTSGQQPCFRAKFIVEEINWLCKRTDIELSAFWSPAVLVHLYRQLFQSARAVLGPLHTASVLRKIRAVVCLGGENAIRGYPLEMLLHNLRPFLTAFHCSEDAVGLYWYLLEAGRPYLLSQLSFLAGLSVAIFASLTAFVASSQDSTTQGSKFASTMSKAQEFRKWLGRFLSTLEPDEEDEKKVETFGQLIQHAKSMTAGGSSSKSTPEGNVLLRLLLDRTANNPLLNETHFFLSISILCKEFSPATDSSDDIIAGQKNYGSCASALRLTLRRVSLPDTFQTWAAYIIGRAYSALGPADLLALSDSESKVLTGPGDDLSQSASYSAVVRRLEDLVWQKDVFAAAEAERCLQMIATNLDRSTTLAVLGKVHDQRLLTDVGFHGFPCPEVHTVTPVVQSTPTLEHWQTPNNLHAWAPSLVSCLCNHLIDDPVLGSLHGFALTAPAMAGPLLPYVVHIVLAAEMDGAQPARAKLHETFSTMLRVRDSDSEEDVKLILSTLLYLRRCVLPNSTTKAQRSQWLEVDFGEAAIAASTFELWHEALLFLELQQSHTHLSTRSIRKSTRAGANGMPEVAAIVFENVDDPDFFYAGHEDMDLPSVIQRLEHEASGLKTLSFQSAVFDAAVRSHEDRETSGNTALSAARALNAANLRAISQAVTAFASGQSQSALGRETSDMYFDLYDWNIRSGTGLGRETSCSLKSLRALTTGTSKEAMVQSLEVGLLECVKSLPSAKRLSQTHSKSLRNLATLAEARDALMLKGYENLDNFALLGSAADAWSQQEDIDEVIPFLNGREHLFGALRQNTELRTSLALTQPQALLLEARAVRQSLQVAQHHSASQFSLSRATYLSRLAEMGSRVGLRIEVASQFDLATTFWSQGEALASVKILQHLRRRDDLKAQDILVEASEILADLGTKAADARLEPPDEIISKYLTPAYRELDGNMMGSKAGRVFHNFATFCDAQLQDQDNRDDYERIAKIRETKELELQELERLLRTRDSKNREGVKHAWAKAKTWYKLDDEEFQRVSANRESLILRCLENYLLSMKACDDFPNDSLRVLSIWLNQADNERVNKTVNKTLRHVPSIKFAGLVNQLTSRLLDTENDFQELLKDLIFRICTDHPYHSMYQLFAASKSRGAKSDDVAASRHCAAGKLSDLLRQKSSSGAVWIAVHNASIAFVRVAQERISDKEVKTGSKFFLRNVRNGPPLISAVEGRSSRIPPPTLKLALRTDKDYSSAPVMTEVEPQISIAGGISAPKITTIRASDGSRNKMLLKGGNDDLRQDAIMEQVFEQVSNLLKDHRATRKRKLGIRTYKVVPLVSNAGIIEFVQGTLPLHDYINPAHTKYFPKDYKPNRCKKEILDVQGKSLQQRVQTYRTVTQNFHPVMRFFFMEYFLDPDEWFYKRLNYSRSTAAISILGHVLGLGDRHGHNILLDTNSGEVVHIDLGVAFEAGRVLPVPEVVPFRLTRDLVDGMGMSGVEGVFRRCCNFTLEALRRDQESIMTILDVLRYDPLYSWSISPVRLQKMQENAEQAAAAAAAGNVTDTNATGTTDGAIADARVAVGALSARKDLNEPSEADRALTVVAKKLGKSLSVEATVNELIRQATDERNLAVLYCGWAAYA